MEKQSGIYARYSPGRNRNHLPHPETLLPTFQATPLHALNAQKYKKPPSAD